MARGRPARPPAADGVPPAPPSWVRRLPGWKETLPPEEKADASGPWKLFEKETELAGPARRRSVGAEPLALEVTEDGSTGITARAKRLPAGEWRVFDDFRDAERRRAELHATSQGIGHAQT